MESQRPGMGVHYILGGGQGHRGEQGQQGPRGQQASRSSFLLVVSFIP